MSPTPSLLPPALKLAATLIALGLLTACGKDEAAGAPPQMPPQDVSVAAPVQKQVADWDEYSGRIEAVDSVELRPRVAGYLDAVHFHEGSMVDKGDLLFTIDDREYRASVAAARADVARAAARIEQADSELARSEALVKARAVSKGELDGRRSEAAQAKADRLAAQARLQQAELNLSFTRIEAPMAGRIGAALVKPGNLVAPGETLLSTLVSVDPVHVVFEGDERAYLGYQKLIRAGERKSERADAADYVSPVEVALSTETEFTHKGGIDFVDNTVNPQTGTIRARAVLPNPDGVFTPGLFARVRMMGAAPSNALLIHEQAVMTDQDRKYVWVVGEGSTALRKDIVLGEAVDGLRIVDEGLLAEDKVVVNGMRKIFFPGQPLAPRDVPMTEPQTPAPAPAAPAAAPEAAKG
jgi:multidrug efflux system membrane fusion protein